VLVADAAGAPYAPEVLEHEGDGRKQLTADQRAAKEARRKALRKTWADRYAPHWGTPQRQCDPFEHRDLQKAVETLCVDYSCDADVGCAAIRQHGERAKACAHARAEINRRCYGGGNKGHRGAQRDATRAANKCRNKFREVIDHGYGHMGPRCEGPGFELEWDLDDTPGAGG
jgi:hypothetical protein